MGILEDAGLGKFHSIIGCNLNQSKIILTKNLQRATKISSNTYHFRSKTIETLSTLKPGMAEAWNMRFTKLATLEADLQPFLSPESEDLKDLQDDALSQLSFQDSWFRCFNGMPFILMGMALFKIWAVPLMACLTPLIAWILPYIFLKFMYKLPISTDQYTDVMKVLWSGNMIHGNTMPTEVPSVLTPRSVFQALVMAFSFIQSLVQPIQNAMHLYKTDATLVQNGNKIIEIANCYNYFRRDLEALGVEYPFRNTLDDIDTTDPRRTIYLLLEQPHRFLLAFKDFAELEILWRIANCRLLHPVLMIERGNSPIFQGTNIRDISLGINGVPSSISMTGETHHAALTGPNGGGKSSFLRAILQSALIAQAYGVAPADKLVMRRFDWIISGLRLQDSPASLSMFETEVYFATELLNRSTANGPGLVLYDELFHSTNPPDGTRTADKFLQRLWAKDEVVSVVSTHVFELVEAAPAHVQRMQCNASVRANGDIVYLYTVKEGICRVSSVQSIWKRFGL
jgi:hypothetical protein